MNITNLPLRVTFYARVSTETDLQLNSLDNQVNYFKEYIKNNDNWIYIQGYIDEGLSGSSTKNRKEFLRMIEDAKKNKFDLIITKEVSRFSRNLSDSIKYTQELINNDVGVFFQTNGINTYDPNAEFILNMMGSVAQEEVKRLSTRIKWGHMNAIKRGHVLGSNSITGYKKNNCQLIIDTTEEEKVKQIFELYATGNYGLNNLAKKLYENGITNSKGNIYDKDTIKRIIKNPKYKGYYRGHTTEVIDYRSKKRINIPVEEQLIYKDEKIPAIISEELWNKANKILEERSTLMKQNKGNAKRINKKHHYTGKLFCIEHTCNFQSTISKRKKITIRWACKNYIRYGKNSCLSPLIKEQDLDEIFIVIFNKIFKNKDLIKKDLINYYNQVNISSNNTKIKNIKKELNIIRTKKNKLLDLKISDIITDADFKIKNTEYDNITKKLNDNLQREQTNIDNLINRDPIFLENKITELLNFNTIMPSLITEFLEKIIISKIDNRRDKINLDIYLNIEDTFKYISNYSTLQQTYFYNIC